MVRNDVTVRLIQAAFADPHVFYAVVGGRGTPDFRVRARDARAAKALLEERIYDALDGAEDLDDGEAYDDAR